MIGSDYVQNIRAIQLRAFLFVIRVGGFMSLTLKISDVLASLYDHFVNGCNSGPSLSGRPCLGKSQRPVGHNPIPFFSPLNMVYIVG